MMFSLDVLAIFFMLSSLPLKMTQATDICSNSSAGPSKTILTVGMLHSKLLVVTEPDKETLTQYIYEMPANSLNDSQEQLFLNDKPKTLAEVWPVLHKDQNYANILINGQIYNSFTAIDSVSEYLFITTLYEVSHTVGVVYDIKNGKVYRGAKKNKGIQEVLISSDKLQNFFAVQIDDNKGLAIMRFKFTGKTILESLNLTESIVPEVNGPYYPLCKVGNDSMVVFKKEASLADDKKNANDSKTTCEPLKYPLSKGFVSKKKVYLFGQDKIYIFPESFYDKPNVPVKVITKEYSSFINCKPVAVVQTDKVTGMSIGLIIGIVLVVLIVILCLVLFCTREVIRHKRRQKHRKKKKKEAAKRKAARGEKAAEKDTHAKDHDDEDELPAGPMGSFLSFFMPSPRSDDVDEPKGRKGGSMSQRSALNSQASVRSVASTASKVAVLSKVNPKQAKGPSSSLGGQSKPAVSKSKLLPKNSSKVPSSTISGNLALSKAKTAASGKAVSTYQPATSVYGGAVKVKGADKKKNSKVK